MGLDEAARIALQLDHGRSDNGGAKRRLKPIQVMLLSAQTAAV